MTRVTGLLAAALLALAAGSGGTRFWLVQEPGDFRAAEAKCELQEAHLMTVRSSVSQKDLSALLENLAGRFWLGLRLDDGCPDPDPAVGLRGFQWVTRDNGSHFFNWAPTFNSSCSAPRCVSVSKESDFRWTQEPCDARLAGFICEDFVLDMCTGLEVAQGESVTYTTLMGLKLEEGMPFPFGTIATQAPSETKHVCFSRRWLQAPWNCEIQEGGCEHKCTVDPQDVPVCYCPRGSTTSPTNRVTCEKIAEDPCLALRCDHACYRSEVSYACACDHGFKLAQDGRSCVDFNDCRDQRQCPGQNFKCINTVGGFQCVCKDGYTKSGDQCVDVDECVSAPCEHKCHNSPGGFSCSCYDGYIVDPKVPQHCVLHCADEECVAVCDPNDAFLCQCPSGYIIEERGAISVCIDLDECSSNFCDQLCTNTFGGYVCSCSPGYELVGQYECVKREGGWTTPAYSPEPTRRPSGVSVGGFVGIILCTVFLIVLVVFLVHHILTR